VYIAPAVIVVSDCPIKLRHHVRPDILEAWPHLGIIARDLAYSGQCLRLVVRGQSVNIGREAIRATIDREGE
jgi:hypothetical protein